jgi:hypothetical protein
MTKQINFVLALCAITNYSFGQQPNRFEIKVKSTDKTFEIPISINKADFSNPITFSFTGDNIPDDLSLSADDIETPIKTNNDFSFKVTDTKKERVAVSIKAKGFTCPNVIIENGASDKGASKVNSTGNTAYDYFYKNFRDFQNINKSYDRKGNKAIFYFNEKGMLLAPAPINVDADDYLIIYMAVPKAQSNSFSIQIDGDYNASDLLIRPYEPIAAAPAQGTGKEEIEYTYITQTFGPFTSDKATIRFFNGDNELTKHLDVRVNKLYNVAIGASFISTDLEKPTFDVFPIPGTTNNTINGINTGSRTLATFNVIYYWKPTVDWVTGKLKSTSNITRGRDVLKEATFLERFNPTFGIALNSEWRENFFFGGNFEFARGGSISAGWHYGKVQELADKNFTLGTSVYSGTKDEIKLTDTWKWGFFFGITLDTRIFNKLLARN